MRRTRTSAKYIECNPLALPVTALCVECEGLLCSPCCSLQTHPRDDFALPPSRSQGERQATTRATSNRKCTRPGCTRPLYARGICQPHYDSDKYARQKARLGNPPDGRSLPAKRCAHEGCGRLVHAERLCKRHRRQGVRP